MNGILLLEKQVAHLIVLKSKIDASLVWNKMNMQLNKLRMEQIYNNYIYVHKYIQNNVELIFWLIKIYIAWCLMIDQLCISLI